MRIRIRNTENKTFEPIKSGFIFSDSDKFPDRSGAGLAVRVHGHRAVHGHAPPPRHQHLPEGVCRGKVLKKENRWSVTLMNKKAPRMSSLYILKSGNNSVLLSVSLNETIISKNSTTKSDVKIHSIVMLITAKVVFTLKL